MLEDIIRAPTFYQISVFGLQLAIILFQLEVVSRIFLCPLEDCRAKNRICFSFDGLFVSSLSQDISRFSYNLASELTELLFFTFVNFILCFLVTMSTTNTMSVGDKVYELLWYQLPRNERLIVRTIMRRSQKPFELKGLGVFVCSLETYVRVRFLLAPGIN